jgi:hypothetical protein
MQWMGFQTNDASLPHFYSLASPAQGSWGEARGTYWRGVLESLDGNGSANVLLRQPPILASPRPPSSQDAPNSVRLRMGQPMEVDAVAGATASHNLSNFSVPVRTGIRLHPYGKDWRWPKPDLKASEGANASGLADDLRTDAEALKRKDGGTSIERRPAAAAASSHDSLVLVQDAREDRDSNTGMVLVGGTGSAENGALEEERGIWEGGQSLDSAVNAIEAGDGERWLSVLGKNGAFGKEALLTQALRQHFDIENAGQARSTTAPYSHAPRPTPHAPRPTPWALISSRYPGLKNSKAPPNHSFNMHSLHILCPRIAFCFALLSRPSLLFRSQNTFSLAEHILFCLALTHIPPRSLAEHV